MSFSATNAGASKPRMRIREVFPKLMIGRHPTGPLNSITDVPGVLVHTESIRKPNGTGVHAINTGVTTILPREDWFDRSCYAGIFSFNGAGELTGSYWIEETGLLRSPIIITNSFSVGACYDGVYQYAVRKHADENGLVDWFLSPVIGETYDGHLNHIGGMAITPDMISHGIEAASADRVPEGCTGGGTGMTCSGYKAGTGSASRVIKGMDGEIYTVAALVQSNYGKDWDLKFGGVPVGRIFMDPEKRKIYEANLHSLELQHRPKKTGPQKDGSIIIIIATDAPMNPTQLKRLAKRGATGVARVGGYGSNQSGDIFLAFSTSADIVGDQDMNWNPVVDNQPHLVDNSINAVFECVADCVEESIYNSICMAETTVGPEGRTVDAIDLDRLRSTLEKWYCTE